MSPDNVQNMEGFVSALLRHGQAVESTKTERGWVHASMGKTPRCCAHIVSTEHR